VIKKLRGKRTQADLAKEAGVTKNYITMLEAGKRKNPSLLVLKRLAKALGVPVAELLG
jgi:transcriptional regulator with XRE-family HTH domain